MAWTGSLLTSGTSLWCLNSPRAPHLVCWPFSLSTLSRLPLVATPTSRLRLPTTRRHPRIARPFTADRQGFLLSRPWRDFQASQALSPQYYTQICHPLPLSRLGSLPTRIRFMAPPGNDQSQNRRTSPGKIATPPHIPSNFTSVWSTGYQDLLWYACSPSSPQPYSWFAVRYVHGFCLMLPPDTHFWSCPCPVGVALPSGNGGLLLIQCCVMPGARHRPPAKPGA